MFTKFQSIRRHMFYAVALSLLLGACQKRLQYQSTVESLPINSEISADARIDSMIAPYKQRLTAEISRVLAYSDTAVERPKNVYEHPLGNFTADLMLQKAQALQPQTSLSVITFGGLRTGFPAGAVTVGHMFELMPFENELVILTVEGKTLEELFEYMLRKKNTALGGVRLEVAAGKVRNAWIGGKPWDPNQTYRVAISDYLANGGDDMSFWKEAKQREETGVKIRDIFIEGVEAAGKKGTIHLQLDGRVKVVE
ncbi:5'-nucleotidase C-terminal domain-containing protein [Thermonema rossianum]|uniref:5'-nucleotidase C-terminal domain-containing protein n=1 Tax=Thermonema rossianum TaxID=55505 RepID=UPI0006922866|nr:5'-nucleotidase C-terminal domain-containing protein [Thermonema rossianum]